MATTVAILESVEYRFVLIEPDSCALFALDTVDGCKLPRVRIPKKTRPVQELQKAIRSAWGVHVLILDFLKGDDSSTPCVIAELLTPLTSRNLERIAPSQLSRSELTEGEHSALLSLLAGKSKSPFTRTGWLDEAAIWIETTTGRKLSHKTDIEQVNAGGPFALVRFHADDGWTCWLKATGEPNAHELSITSLLSQMCRGYIPEFLASKPEWNAWLMSGDALEITSLPANPLELFRLLEDAVGSLAELQMKTLGAESELLDAGAFDQRLDVQLNRADVMFDYLDEVMDLSGPSGLPRLGKERLREIRIAFKVLCERLQHLGIPETIVHGDMNPGNIVIGHGHCQFIDWSEAYIGPSLVTLEHLLLLNTIENPGMRAFTNSSLKQGYVSVWATICAPDALEEGFRYMPLMAALSTLYGRGEWLNSPERYDARHLSYARTLGTYMDRAMRRPELQEALCALCPAQVCMQAAATFS
jgi:phosphotransferase family enzyme